MDNQPSTGGSIVPVKKNGEDLVDEQIDERILRLLGLEYIFDIDYDTYTSLLKEKMVAARMAKTQIPTEEAELLTNEYKKIRGKKGRFKVKKITADSFKKGSAVGVNLGKQKALIGKPLKALPPADKMTGGSDIKEIIDALAEIIKSLTSQNKLAKDSAEKSRIAGEAGQRGAKESRLEKGFKFAIKAAEKIIAPIKSLLDRIIDFFVAIFVGRALIKLLDWFSDSKNQDKIKAIGRFLGDQWPKLLALYIMFGTGLGKFVGFLTKIVIRGGIKLAAAAAGLLAKAGVGKAAGAAKFLGGKYGKLLGAGLEVAATVGTTMAVSKGIENFGGIGGEEQKTQGYSGGGFVIPKFAGGGLNFKGMMGGAGMGAMFGPLGMLLGAGLGSGKIQETVSGLIGGKKGVDKVPAMLTDGEFVMSRGAVQKYGVDTLESMNAAGGGTNQPKIVSGTTYAAGGGMMGMRGDRGLSTRGVQVGATGLEKQGFDALKNAKSQHFGSKGLLSPGGKGVYSAPQVGQIGPGGLRPGYGASRYVQAGSNPLNSLMDMFRGPKPPVQPGGVLGSISPGGVRGTNLFEPQRVVNPRQFQKGQKLFQKVQGGQYPKSALANRLRGQASTSGFKPGQVNIPFNQLPKAAASSGYGPQALRLLGTGARVASAAAPLQLGIEGGMLLGDLAIKNKRGRDKEKEAQQESYVKTITGKNYDTSVSGMPAQLTQTKPMGLGENVKHAIHQSKNFLSGMFDTPSGTDASKLGAGRQIEPQSPPISRLNPAQIQTQNNVPKINPPSKSKVKVVYATSPGGMPKLNTSSGASPSVPSFSAVHPNSESRRRNAAVLGVK